MSNVYSSYLTITAKENENATCVSFNYNGGSMIIKQ